MVVNPVTIHPEATLADALKLMAEQPHLRHSGGRARHQAAGRHRHQPRRALRHRSHAAGRELMTKERLVTVRESVNARGRQAPAAPAPHREADRGRRRLSLRRPHHRQGHREGAALSQRLQGRAGAAARRRRDRHRRGWRASAPRRCSTPASTCWWSIPRTAIPRASSTRCARIRRLSNYDPDHRRQCRHRRGRRGADRRRRRRGQGRHRPGLDLHHARRRRRRRAATDRDPRRGRGVPQARRAGDRRRRHQVLRRSRQGDRGRRRLRHARLALRRHRREPGRGLPLPGPQLQILSRHGLGRRHGARLGRPLFPGGSVEHAEAGAGGRRGPRAAQGPGRQRRPSARRRPARGDGLYRQPHHRRDAAELPLRAHHRLGPAREPRPRHRHHPRGAELPAGDL